MTTSVLLCSHLATDANGRSDLRFVQDLCTRPDRIKPALGGADRLVLGMCDREYSLGAIQAEVRRAGIDPLGVELFDATTMMGDAERIDTILNAKAARAEAFAESNPANAKISLPQRVNRRELLHGPPPEYSSAPSIDPSLCSARSGCRACVDVCPQGALSIQGRQVHHDRSICEPCGLCITTCPTGATVNPATTPIQVEAEIAALLDPSVGPTGTRGIAFTCSRGKVTETTCGWHTVTVPCVGMMPPAWLLAPLLMGAGAVAARPCSETGCSLGHDARAVTAVEFCREYLQSIGESSDRVSTAPLSRLPVPLPEITVTDPFGARSAVAVMQALAAGNDQERQVVLDHPGAPTGLVTLSNEACTGCTMCAQVCPTEALASLDSGDQVTITFDAAQCTGCAQCLHRCPELDQGAMALVTRVDLVALSRGRTTLFRADTVRCESCGRPIGPAPMLERITKMLAPEQEAVRAMITSRCVDCRGTTA